MIRALLRVFEVLFLRAGPGLLNVATLIQLAAWLTPAQFGDYSTTVAATGVAASVGFGPVTFSIVAQYAQMSREGRGPDYVAAAASLAAGAAVLLATAAAGASFAIGERAGAWLLVMASVGAHSVLQELLRAKLRLWSYGLSAGVQALSFLGLTWTLIGPKGSVDAALLTFAASYGLAALVSLCLLGFPPLWRPKLALLSTSLKVGRGYTLASVADNGLTVGLRYLLMWLAPAQVLAVYSFALDLALRLSGFMLNAASFAFVPQAFREAAAGQAGRFRTTLFRGALIGAGLAGLSVVVVLVWRAVMPWPDFAATPFDAAAFGLVSLAVVVNRVKKLIADPFALRANRTFMITAGYLCGVTLACPILILFVKAGLPYGGEIATLAAYLAAMALSLFLLRREIFPAP